MRHVIHIYFLWLLILPSNIIAQKIAVDTSNFVIYNGNSSGLICSNTSFFIDLDNDSINDLEIARDNRQQFCRNSYLPVKDIWAQVLTSCFISASPNTPWMFYESYQLGDSVSLGSFYNYSGNVVIYKKFLDVGCTSVTRSGGVDTSYMAIKKGNSFYLIKINIPNGGDCFEVIGNGTVAIGINEANNSVNVIDMSFNQNQNELNVTLPNTGGNARLRAYSLNGSILMEQNLNTANTTIDTEFLPSGIFFFEAYIKDLHQRKVIKVFKN